MLNRDNDPDRNIDSVFKYKGLTEIYSIFVYTNSSTNKETNQTNRRMIYWSISIGIQKMDVYPNSISYMLFIQLLFPYISKLYYKS